MKGFLEHLDKVGHLHGDTQGPSEATKKFRSMQLQFSKLIGRRALYKCKSTKEVRVVTIKSASDRFLSASYSYYGRDTEGQINLTIMYSSILCGDDTLELE